MNGGNQRNEGNSHSLLSLKLEVKDSNSKDYTIVNSVITINTKIELSFFIRKKPKQKSEQKRKNYFEIYAKESKLMLRPNREFSALLVSRLSSLNVASTVASLPFLTSLTSLASLPCLVLHSTPDSLLQHIFLILYILCTTHIQFII